MVHWGWLVAAAIGGFIFGFGVCAMFAINSNNKYEDARHN